jgi:hypothetical protein
MYSKYFITLTLSFFLLSCNYLDFDESTGKTDDVVLGYFDELSRLVTHVYGQVSPDWGLLNGALLESATDNSIYTWQDSKVYDIYNNTWSPINLIDNKWVSYYSAIRSANLFLDKFSLEKLERFEYNANYKEDIEKSKLYPYEVRFLRSFFYFELIKRYGDIPLITSPYQLSEINSVNQTPFDSIVDFIVAECDSITPYLPVSHRDFYAETGRVTRGAVMALKSRVLLYAASPLHNPTNDLKKWERAAKASGELISVATKERWYDLDPNFNLFSNGNDVLNAKELILERRGSTSSAFEERNMPIGFHHAKSGNTPTQNLVDAFEMRDGTPFDWNNPAHASKPFQNRDPRLARTIVFNNSRLMGILVETFNGGRNGQPINGATLSGYYMRKYIDERISIDPVNPIQRTHHYVLFRYAEIYLNYAEALNEYNGPDYRDENFTISSRDALNVIRNYARMPLINVNYTKEDFRKRIRNERRIELAFEDHRFWDIRRWKIGDVVKNIYGISIEKENSNYTYNKILIQNRIWENKMYLYPIPQTELYINKNLKQNPDW